MNILVAYNGSKASWGALNLAKNYAETQRAKIYVITSMPGGTKEKPEDVGKARKNLEEARQFLQQFDVECETYDIVRGLSPGEDLVRFAKENQIGHIFVGIEKKSRTSKIILGSTAQYIILKAPCPVTTTK